MKNELRIGNYVYDPINKENVKLVAIEQGNRPITLGGKGTSSFSGFDCLQPIPLSEQILLKCPNHKRVNGKNILNTIYFEIGRNRVISIGNIGTGNEAIWLCEIDPNIENRITDLVCIHNFDYDGKIMLHKFQNIFHSLTNEELTVNL